MVGESSFNFSCLGKLDEFFLKKEEEGKKKKTLNIVPLKTGNTLLIQTT